MKLFHLSVLFLSLGAAAWCQSGNGAITGQVRDTSGATVADAKVTLKDRGTAVTRGFTTEAIGAYRFPGVPVGTYDLIVEKPGFRTFIREGIEIHISEVASMDVELQVGAISDTVTVTERPPLLQTASTEMGGLIDREFLQDLPLSRPGAREMADSFTLLLPGVNAGQDRTLGRFSGEGFVSNGSQAYSRDLLIQGSSYTEMDSPGRMISQVPPPSAIQEFKMSTGTYSAEYGRSAGGLINLSIRSGTNQYHGAMNENLRNNVFDARGFFPNVRPQDTQSEFGASLGGPLRIPKIYNGKDKTFFFAFYNGFRWRTVLSNALVTMPTANMLKGDFSEGLAVNQVIYDPSTNRPDATGATTRDAFPGNQIPTGRFSKVSSNLLPYSPALSYPGRFLLNYITATTEATNDDRFGIKLDHSLSSRQQLNGYFQMGTFYRKDVGPLPPPIAQGSNREQYTRMIRLSDQIVLRPNLIYFMQFSFNRDQTPLALITAGTSIAQDIGLKGLTPNAGMPSISFGGSANNLSSEANETTTENAFLYSANLSWTKGRHSLKFGGEIRRQQFNDRNFNRVHGTFNFNPVETAFPFGTLRSTTGNGVASFLLGGPDSDNVAFVTTVPGYRFFYATAFVQDDIRLSRTITINMGLRYEVPWPLTEVADRLSFFSPTAPNAAAGGHPGALVFAGNGTGKIGKGTVVNKDFREFGPRVGIAWTVNPKTVIRSAYGIFYGLGGAVSMNGPGNYSLLEGYNSTFQVISPNLGIDPAFNWDNGVPGPAIKLPTLDPTFANGRSISNNDRPEDGRVPYIQNWNFTVQRQAGQNLVFQGAYVGSKGTRLSSQLVRTNLLPQQYLALGSLLTQQVTSPAAIAAGLGKPYPTFTGTVSQSLLPFPQYVNIVNPHEASGNSTYHSLQLMATKRTSFGLTLLTSYTFSKSITNSFSQIPAQNPGPVDVYNPRLMKAVSRNQIPQVWTYSLLYQFPMGKGKRFFSGAKGAANVLAGGWSMAVVSRYQSGFTLAVARNVLLLQGVNERSDIPRNQFDPAVSNYMNPKAFSLLGPFDIANVPVRDPNLRGWAFYSEDVSLIKQLPISEKVKGQLSCQVYNIPNRVIFSDPSNLTFGNPLFGRVSGQSNNPRQMQLRLSMTF
jgi:hypothetical protein